ncbi:hypothetical protein HCU67_06245 [Muricauda sp. DJ-13]|uniref:Uncharacterized protein n=2 Tax=Croceivirga thetidis TaxID=2721623 RepID=A0ABX1GNS1_9FLAO|nr:hypothetical protein [Croceivirga thetidis]
MDAILKSMVFGLVFIITLILTAPVFNAEKVEKDEDVKATIEAEGEIKHIAYTYSERADYPSEFLVG